MREAGAYVGLVSALAILYGGFARCARKGSPAQDAPAEIETDQRSSEAGPDPS